MPDLATYAQLLLLSIKIAFEATCVYFGHLSFVPHDSPATGSRRLGKIERRHSPWRSRSARPRFLGSPRASAR